MQANMTMADNKNNRKSKRNFSLEKPIERRFDIEKDVDDAHVVPENLSQAKLKNVAQEKKEDSLFNTTSKQQVNDVPPTMPISEDNRGDGGGKSIRWIVVALFIIAIAVCVYFFMNSNKTDDSTNIDEPQVEQNDSNQNQANDSTANSKIENSKSISSVGNESHGDDLAANQGESSNSDKLETQSSTSTKSNPTVEYSSESQSEVSAQSSNRVSVSSIEQKAKDVWKGVYGNNPDRRKKLGNDYEAVQKLVNEMYRQRLN